jgi:type I restriction enzyme S subunit
MSNVNQRFVSYLLQSSGFVGAVVANSFGVSYPAINASDLVRLPIVQPPVREQEAIVQYLDRETVRIDNQFQKVESVIEKLEEYRSTLIINAVTGKIDIRDFCTSTITEQREVLHD